MDKMKQEVKSKLTYWERLCALFTILMATNIWNSFRPISGGDNFIDFFRGFQLGVAMAFLVCAVIKVIRFRKILKNEDVRERYSKHSLEVAKKHDLNRTLKRFEEIYEEAIILKGKKIPKKRWLR